MQLFQWTLALLAATAAANRLDQRAVSENCYTSFASTRTKSVPTVSHTVTYTLLFTKTKFVHPTTTVTPPAVSSTVVETDQVIIITTAQGVTDTATVSTTVTTTDTSTAPTSTQTSTITDFATTSTTTTSTTTVAPVSNFVPVQSSLSESYEQRRKRDNFVARLKARALLSTRRTLGTNAAPRYPKRVLCTVFNTVTETDTATYTGGTAVTESASTPTVTVTQVITLTTISSIFPSEVTATVTNTETDSVVVTTTPTTTQTTSTTITDTETQTASATFYAQCAPDNFADEGPGGQLYNVQLYQTTTIVETTTPDAYSCCVACVLSQPCSFGGLTSSSGVNNCELAGEPTCNPQTTYFYEVNEETPNAYPVQFFNGNCGELSGYLS